MIYELTGSTGAGKSTAFVNIVKTLDENSEKIFTILDSSSVSLVESHIEFIDIYKFSWKEDIKILDSIIMSAIKNVRFLLVSLHAVLKYVPVGDKILMIRVLLRRLGLAYIAEKKSKDGYKVIVDEGVSHLIHNIFVSKSYVASEKDIKFFFSAIPKTIKIILVEPQEEEFFKRLMRRKNWSTRVSTQEELSSFINNALIAFSYIRNEENVIVYSHDSVFCD